MASKLQFKYGDKVEIWNSYWHATIAAYGEVIKVAPSGNVTVAVDEIGTSKALKIGDKIQFNANHWNDMIICQQRGATIGTGLTAHARKAG